MRLTEEHQERLLDITQETTVVRDTPCRDYRKMSLNIETEDKHDDGHHADSDGL